MDRRDPIKNLPQKVRVHFHSSYKGEEIPRFVIIGQRKYPIEKITERKRVLDHNSGKKREEYKIKIMDKTAILKIYDPIECELMFLIS